MPELVDDLVLLPTGSHCVAIHVTREEAADHAVAFIEGSAPDRATSYWVDTPSLAAYYTELLKERSPQHVGCVHVLEREHIEPQGGHLRPVEEISEFLRANPDGVTGGADTISRYWSLEDLPAHLEYEEWFQAQPRDRSRFLCPYDLRAVPVEEAPEVLRELGFHHSHVALSSSPEPAVRLLQLFLFGETDRLPRELEGTLAWAVESGYLDPGDAGSEFALTASGDRLVREWSRAAVIDW